MADAAEIERIPLGVRARSGRTLDQRLGMRMPALAKANLRLVGALPPRSRVRRAAVARAVRLALEAYNRRDLDAAVLAWEAEVDYRPDPNWARAGLVEPSYRGPDGYRRYVATVDEVWGGENTLGQVELIYLGDRFLTLAKGQMRAQASGVSLSENYGLLSTFVGGRLLLHEEHYDRAEAFRAAGLDGPLV